jgi:hypothetical protein
MESIMSVQAGLVGSSEHVEIIAVTYSGIKKLICFHYFLIIIINFFYWRLVFWPDD